MSDPIDVSDPSRLPPRLTSHEVAALNRVKVRTVWDWAQQGRGPKPIRVGRRLLYDRDEVLEHLGMASR